LEEVHEPEGWLWFGPDIAMPVKECMAVTTLDRGSLAPEARDFRRGRRQRAAFARQAKAQGRGVEGRGHADKWRVGKRKDAGDG